MEDDGSVAVSVSVSVSMFIILLMYALLFGVKCRRAFLVLVLFVVLVPVWAAAGAFDSVNFVPVEGSELTKNIKQ